MKTPKALGILLTYPSDPLLDAVPALDALFEDEGVLEQETREAVLRLGVSLRRMGTLAAQERYTALFDGSRALSLHLFEHVHGDSRDRGQALSSLSRLYAAHGLILAQRELPDYLPLVCEFLSFAPESAAKQLLGDVCDVLRLLHEALSERDAEYASVLAALLEVAGQSAVPLTNGDQVTREATTATDAPVSDEGSSDFDALDRAWEESPIEFGPGAAHDSCQPVPQLVPGARLVSHSKAQRDAKSSEGI